MFTIANIEPMINVFCYPRKEIILLSTNPLNGTDNRNGCFQKYVSYTLEDIGKKQWHTLDNLLNLIHDVKVTFRIIPSQVKQHQIIQ